MKEKFDTVDTDTAGNAQRCKFLFVRLKWRIL